MYSNERNSAGKCSKTILDKKWSKELAMLTIEGKKASGVAGYLRFNS